MNETLDERIGRRYRVHQPDVFFPREFTVTEVSGTAELLHIKSAVETYWVTRIRFEATEAAGRIEAIP